MVKPVPPSENLGSVPLKGGLTSTGKPYGGSFVNGGFVPHAVGELHFDGSRPRLPFGAMDSQSARDGDNTVNLNCAIGCSCS